jgi:transcriptional repressor NrdR
MFCPYCGCEDTKVVDKRDNGETGVTRRRRECINCHKRFTTYERIENIILNVRKRDGRVEEFDREKLKRAILKAVKKRDIPAEKIDEVIVGIEQKLMNSDKQEISSRDIGNLVLKSLSKIDKLGAVLFAAVYKEMNTLEELQAELADLADSD